MLKIQKYALWMLVMSGFALSACAAPKVIEEKVDDNSSVASSSSEVSSSSEESSNESDDNAPKRWSSSRPIAKWSSHKRAQLATFMNKWGQGMGQQYRSYEPGQDVYFYGVPIPEAFEYMYPAVGDEVIDWEWSTIGESAADYAVVAIYSDADYTEYSKHLYMFTIHKGNPEVLITEQNQGNPNNWIYFNHTQNQELQNGFADIVNNNY